MKKWEYEIVSKARYGYNVDYETKRIAHLILEREGKLVKEQLFALESKEKALQEQLEKLEEELMELEN